jgi:hypothetical protein
VEVSERVRWDWGLHEFSVGISLIYLFHYTVKKWGITMGLCTNAPLQLPQLSWPGPGTFSSFFEAIARAWKCIFRGIMSA